MQNRWLLNVGLAALVLALALLVVYKPGTEKPAAGTPLTAMSAEAVTRIAVIRPNQKDIVLEKGGDGWRLTAPRRARANDFRVGELRSLATARSDTHFPAVATELDKYGLDRPQLRVSLNDAEIAFGGMHPIKSLQYVLHADVVHLIPPAVFRSASAPLNDFLSTSLLEDKLKPVAFMLPKFRVIKTEAGGWRREPEDKELTSDRVNRFVEEWRYARALSVMPYSGKPPHERITLRFSEDSPAKSLEIGVLAYKPELVLYRKDEGLEYHFTEDTAKRLIELTPDDAGTPGG